MKEGTCWKNAGESGISYCRGCVTLISWCCETFFFFRSIRQELISKNKVEPSQEDEEENHQENISVTTTDSGKGNFKISIIIQERLRDYF